MSSSSDNKNKNEFPPQKNDADCYNCAGVTLLSEEMKKRGMKPKCFGFEYKAGKSIPPEMMAKLEKAPTLPPNSSVYIVGLSQASARMHRMGQVPMSKFGVVIFSSMDSFSNERKNSSSNLAPPNADPIEEGMKHKLGAASSAIKNSTSPITPFHNPVIDRLSSAFSAENLTAFARAYGRSCGRMWHGMGNVLDESVHLPQALFKGSSQMIFACDKMAHKLADSVRKIISSRDDQEKK